MKEMISKEVEKVAAGMDLCICLVESVGVWKRKEVMSEEDCKNECCVRSGAYKWIYGEFILQQVEGSCHVNSP